MLSLFPYLLIYQGFAPLLLRLTLGAIFIFWAYGKLKKRTDIKEILQGLVKAIIGILLVIGLYTQLAALVSVIFLAICLLQKIQKRVFLSDGVNYYLILFIISITLLLTGPGFIAFDLPL